MDYIIGFNGGGGEYVLYDCRLDSVYIYCRGESILNTYPPKTLFKSYEYKLRLKNLAYYEPIKE